MADSMLAEQSCSNQQASMGLTLLGAKSRTVECGAIAVSAAFAEALGDPLHGGKAKQITGRQIQIGVQMRVS